MTRTVHKESTPSRLMQRIGLIITGLGLALFGGSWIFNWATADDGGGANIGAGLGIFAGIGLTIPGVVIFLVALVLGRILDRH